MFLQKNKTKAIIRFQRRDFRTVFNYIVVVIVLVSITHNVQNEVPKSPNIEMEKVFELV